MADKKEIDKKKEALRKMRFYDRNFKVFGISLLVAVILTLLFDYLTGGIGIIFVMVALFPMVAINWGMLYHQIKSKSYGWLTLTIVLFSLGLAPISLMVFYFVKMRKEFKRGKGSYEK